MKNNTLSPLLLRSTIGAGEILPVGWVGSATPLDIFNPNKTAMLVDQFRFRVGYYGVDGLEGIDPRSLGRVAVEVLLGSIPLTRDYVSLGALCPRYNGLQPTPDVINANGPGPDPIAVWHLPKPLYVPPNVQLSVRVRIQALNQEDTAGVTGPIYVAVAGRSLPSDFPIPGEIDIPWVTEAFCNDNTVTEFVSRDNALVNSNNVPLDVAYFSGFNVQGANDGNFITSPNPTFTAQLTASNGTMLVRDRVPFFALFPSSKNILPVSARLQPGQFFRAEFAVEVPDNAGELPAQNVAFSSIAMHGTRKVQSPGTFGG